MGDERQPNWLVGAVLRGFRNKLLLVCIFFGFAIFAGFIGEGIGRILGLSRDASEWVMFSLFFGPPVAATLWIGLRNSN